MKPSQLLSALCLCLAAWSAAAQSPAHIVDNCEDPRPLRFALIPFKNQAAHEAQYRPLIRQLESVLGREVTLVSGKSYGAVVEGLINGSIDLAELGPASYGIALNRGARLSVIATLRFPATPTVEAGSAYQSLLITRKDRKFRSVEDLRGATLSLTDPASTSGGVLPRRAMEKQLGKPLESHFKRVTFSGSHDRSIEVVRKGLVDAAFVSSAVIDEALRRGKLHRDEIDILWRSPLIPYDPFVHRAQLCPALSARIREVFLGNGPALQGMFQELGASGFAPTSEADYREIRDLLPLAQ